MQTIVRIKKIKNKQVCSKCNRTLKLLHFENAKIEGILCTGGEHIPCLKIK